MALPYEKRPKLGYIPGGTVNDVASTLGLSKDTVRAAQEIMDGHPFPLDIGSFGPDRFFTYVAAFGIFTDVPYETPQEDKRHLGPSCLHHERRGRARPAQAHARARVL